MDAQAILTFVKEYGLPLVLLVLLIVWLKPKADQAWNILMERARGLPPPNPHKGLDKMLEVDVDLSHMIAEAVHEAESDFVSIWQFHNGAVSFGGIPFLRISVTHQQVRSGFTGWGHNYQNLPTSLFVACASFKDMIETLKPAVVQCSDSEGNETIIGILKAHDIKTMYVCPVRDSRDVLIALITFSYTEKHMPSEEFCETITSYVSRACVLLELQARLSKGG